MSNLIEKVVSQVFIEKSLQDFYCEGGTCAGWERNVIDQPTAVKNIISNGAERIAESIGVGEHIDQEVARMIDHTLLKPEATPKEIKYFVKKQGLIILLLYASTLLTFRCVKIC